MNQAIEAALSNSPDVSGYLVSDSNGLAISGNRFISFYTSS